MAKARTSGESTLGKKLIMGFSGLLLIGYLIIHLAANLLVFAGDGGRLLNLYSYTLHQFGPILTVIRIALGGDVPLPHRLRHPSGAVQNRRARSSRYAMTATKGGPSKLTPASRWMIVTGLVLMVFVPLHVNMFTLGPLLRNGDRRQAHPRPVPAGGGAVQGARRRLLLRGGHALFVHAPGPRLLERAPVPGRHRTGGGLPGRCTRSGIILAILLAGGFFVLPIYTYFFIPLP